VSSVAPPVIGDEGDFNAGPGARRFSLAHDRAFLTFVVRRLAALVLLVLGITLVAFVLTHLVPGNPFIANLGVIGASHPATVHAYEVRYGLNKPLPVQYVVYLWHLLQGNLGTSIQTQRPVSTDIATFFPATAELALYAIVIAVVVGVTFGVFAALYRNRLPDHVLRIASLAGISMPTFWIGLLALYIFFYRLGWFPDGARLNPGQVPPPDVTGMFTVDALLDGNLSLFWQAFRHIVLPAVVLASFSVGLLTRFTRSSVLEVIGTDYIRAARAKGLPQRTVIVRHILRAALPSVVTVIGLVFASVLTGAILVEHIYSWPGMGQYAYQSATNLDIPAITGTCILVAVVYATINFLVDVLYSIIDPRVRLS